MQHNRTRYRWLPAFIAGMALLGAQLVHEASAPTRVDAGALSNRHDAKQNEPVSPLRNSPPVPESVREDRSPSTQLAPEYRNLRVERPSRKRGKGHYKHKKSKKNKHRGNDDD